MPHWSTKKDPFAIPGERRSPSPDSNVQGAPSEDKPPINGSGTTVSSTSNLSTSLGESTQGIDPVNFNALQLSKVDPKSGFGGENTSGPIFNAVSNFMGGAQPYPQYQYQAQQATYQYQWPQSGHVLGYGWSVGCQPTPTVPPPAPPSYAHAVHGNMPHQGGNSSQVNDDDVRSYSSRPQKSSSPATTSSSSSSEDEAQSSSSKRKPSKPTPSHSPRKASHIVKSMDELSVLGNWELLGKKDDMHKIIVTYVNNSSGGKKSDGTVKVHQIHHLKPGRIASAKQRFLDTEDFKMMLWWKTSPEGVKRLERKEDGCIAFYDRLARALSVKPEELKQPCRQIILLCQITLGDKMNHSKGYQHWHNKAIPRPHNSIKGAGRLRPIWGQNETTKKKVIIPCGETTVDKGMKHHELEYNEYLVFHADQIRIKYAVDVEIIPKKGG